ncbi:MAG: hypothetical protein V4602_18590 [Pseudomonadota bacterium]
MKTDQPAVTMTVADHRSCRNVISPGHFHEGDGGLQSFQPMELTDHSGRWLLLSAAGG